MIGCVKSDLMQLVTGHMCFDSQHVMLHVFVLQVEESSSSQVRMGRGQRARLVKMALLRTVLLTAVPLKTALQLGLMPAPHRRISSTCRRRGRSRMRGLSLRASQV
jgi:hypothetical protein